MRPLAGYVPVNRLLTEALGREAENGHLRGLIYWADGGGSPDPLFVRMRHGIGCNPPDELRELVRFEFETHVDEAALAVTQAAVQSERELLDRWADVVGTSSA